jgi:TonB family protein
MNWWQYLLLVNIYLVLFYAFYVLLLRKETFFQLNRVYLVTAALLSFFIPLIQVDWVRNLFITQQVKYTIYSSPVMVYGFKPMEATHISIGQILAVLYGAGILFLSLRLIWQLIKLKRVINQPQATAAYSFFKKVKLNEENADNLIIEAHEQVHAQQWHSADVLLIELIMIINWFNPVVYMYRFAIKHIHEYIADRQAVQAGTNKAEYALLLLSQTFNTPAHQLVNPFFNHSLLKQRIIMLQKNKSQRISLIKYGLSAPLFILMLILSSATINNSKTVTVINNKAHQIFLTPATPVILGDALAGDKPTVAEKGTSGTNETTVVDTTKKSGQIFTEVEQVPEFPGGLDAFGRFLGTNLRYPKAERDKGIQGRVIATFVVETDGSLLGLKIARGISKGLDEESLRVLRQSPNWKPGIQNGKKVRVQYSVPISFTLANDKSGKPVSDKTKEIATADENASQGTGVIYTSVEQVPEFPGGLNALGRFLGTNIRYPSAAREKHIQGRVILTFVVEADGSLSSFKILRGVSPDLDAEALRVMAISPKWEPGIENSKKVRVQYSIPISFTLADDKPASNKTGAIKSDNNANTYANVKRSKDENDSVLIRRSLTGPQLSNEPLYVLDGKEITAGDMKMINPNTIQSINVLKDKSAAAIYGDKGANGVIVITSKSKKKAVEPTKDN